MLFVYLVFMLISVFYTLKTFEERIKNKKSPFQNASFMDVIVLYIIAAIGSPVVLPMLLIYNLLFKTAKEDES